MLLLVLMLLLYLLLLLLQDTYGRQGQVDLPRCTALRRASRQETSVPVELSWRRTLTDLSPRSGRLDRGTHSLPCTAVFHFGSPWLEILDITAGWVLFLLRLLGPQQQTAKSKKTTRNPARPKSQVALISGGGTWSWERCGILLWRGPCLLSLEKRVIRGGKARFLPGREGGRKARKSPERGDGRFLANQAK